MPAKLSTHVLDTAHGCPARDVRIEIWSLAGGTRRLLKTVRTNADGRTDEPLLGAGEMQAGHYELVFYVGDYFDTRGSATPPVRFLDRVPVQFVIANPAESYHVPLLVSPWAYTTYRGS
jgi:5-hydroxyisourate hydrolase